MTCPASREEMAMFSRTMSLRAMLLLLSITTWSPDNRARSPVCAKGCTSGMCTAK